MENRIIVVASNNDNKIKEIRDILTEFEIKKASDIIKNFDVNETGATFCENARLKAEALRKYTDEMVLADDSGLEVFALNNEPGIYSARYSEKQTDEANLNKLLNNMKNVEDRRARFVCCMVLIGKFGAIQKEGYVYGSILQTPIGDNGFGYDPVFVPDGYSISFAQMSKDLKNKLSHRKNALEKIKMALEEIL